MKDVIFVEGVGYKKVNRLAQAGDVVVFNETKYGAGHKVDTPYEVILNTLDRLVFYAGDVEYLLYDDEYTRTLENIDVYEKMKKPKPKPKPTRDHKPEPSKTNPSYYQTGNHDVIDSIIELRGNEAAINFCIGNVYKYITRFDKKNGVEDINKALTYLNRLKDIYITYNSKHHDEANTMLKKHSESIFENLDLNLDNVESDLPKGHDEILKYYEHSKQCNAHEFEERVYRLGVRNTLERLNVFIPGVSDDEDE